jgi:hypothetical protein
VFEGIKTFILESSLLPILEAALRSGSLLEIAKESTLFNTYLDIVEQLCKNQKLMFVLQDLSKDYIPAQKVSISKLLLKLAEQSQIFISVWNNEDSSDDDNQDTSR